MTRLTRRPRRLRSTPAIRRLVAETRVHPAQLLLPVFVADGRTETYAEIDPEEKHRTSHRANAFAKLVAEQFGGESDTGPD